MKSRLSLKPGQKGTKALVDQYGASLLYVRYRYDEARGVRLKTVELVVEEKPWQPRHRFHDEDMVPVVNFTEKALRDELKAAGGIWDSEDKLWYVPYGAIHGTALEGRIMIGAGKSKETRKHLK
jgi:hypothetical protein